MQKISVLTDLGLTFTQLHNQRVYLLHVMCTPYYVSDVHPVLRVCYYTLNPEPSAY